MTVRVRIAPSPTGFLHVGTARSALFNWLFARHHGGTFIVRIDDTDVERSEQRFEDDILGSLRWLGLEWDEGVEIGGPHGTYRQSDRFDRYRDVARALVGSGAAYYDDRSPELLDELRARAQKEGRHPGFYIRRLGEEATSGVIRMAVPQDAAVEFHDVVRDDMRFEADSVDDFVILRSDGTPTYHLASTVDDVDYGITHVVRGEDLLSSTPKHILVARAMGAEPATYAHLPLLFGPDGKKLSKRHGDTSLRHYIDAGFLRDAMFNALALLGWSPGEDRTIFTVDEAIAAFDLDKVSKNPAIFDEDKLQWMNGEYLRAMPPAVFVEQAMPFLNAGLGHPPDEGERATFERIAPLVQERTKVLTEVPSQVAFLYTDDLAIEEESWEKVMTADGVGEVLDVAAEKLDALDAFDHESVELALRAMLEQLQIGARKGLQPVRVAVTGSTVSPPLFESIAVLGLERTLERIRSARRRID
jgi:glutamyl-tRNA synthetase